MNWLKGKPHSVINSVVTKHLCVLSTGEQGGHFSRGPHTSQSNWHFGSTNLGVNKGFLGEGVLQIE